MKYHYTITLTDQEVNTLGWAANRGYFPTETYDAMFLADGEEDNESDTHVWLIPEHAAWSITMMAEEDPTLFTLASALR